MLGGLFEVFAGAAFAHHLVEEILDDHEEEQGLALLAAGHAREHVQKFGVYFIRELLIIVG